MKIDAGNSSCCLQCALLPLVRMDHKNSYGCKLSNYLNVSFIAVYVHLQIVTVVSACFVPIKAYYVSSVAMKSVYPLPCTDMVSVTLGVSCQRPYEGKHTVTDACLLHNNYVQIVAGLHM